MHVLWNGEIYSNLNALDAGLDINAALIVSMILCKGPHPSKQARIWLRQALSFVVQYHGFHLGTQH